VPQKQIQSPFAFGYVGPGRVLGTIAVDRLLVELTSEAIEIELVLLGLVNQRHVSQAAAAADWIDAKVGASRGRGTVYLPRPVHTTHFIRSLASGGIFAGLIFLAGDDQSLNSRAADARICGVDPECPYLQSRWQPTLRAVV